MSNFAMLRFRFEYGLVRNRELDEKYRKSHITSPTKIHLATFLSIEFLSSSFDNVCPLLVFIKMNRRNERYLSLPVDLCVPMILHFERKKHPKRTWHVLVGSTRLVVPNFVY